MVAIYRTGLIILGGLMGICSERSVLGQFYRGSRGISYCWVAVGESGTLWRSLVRRAGFEGCIAGWCSLVFSGCVLLRSSL